MKINRAVRGVEDEGHAELTERDLDCRIIGGPGAGVLVQGNQSNLTRVASSGISACKSMLSGSRLVTVGYKPLN